MKNLLAIIWLVTLTHMIILGITSSYAKQVESNINTFIVRSNR